VKRLLLVSLAMLLLVAWDTSEDEEHPWTSSYLVNVPVNEHSSISDLCLQDMGADRVAIAAGDQEFLRVVDLNASFFRRAELSTHTRGDDPSTTLEERDVPSPALLSGMPDYSWTIYDWINKNSLCPAVPPEAREVAGNDICHEFKGWLGSLNSVHFGTQAELTYAHMHRIAVNLGARAAELRSALAADPNAAVEFADFVREAEYEALAYEGYAQHFLQDRWSSGHMWERWNAGDYALLPDKDALTNLLIGSMAGIVHGAQSVLRLVDGAYGNIPDPLCSPEVDGTTVSPIVWSSDELGLHPGVGDYRWGEIVGTGEGMFAGGNYQVSAQYRQLIECGQRGWADVIRALGSNGDGSFGELGVVLDERAPPVGASALTGDCEGAWATNKSMNVGWGIADFGTVARVALGGLSVGLGRAHALELTRIQWNLWEASWRRPDGTDIAMGGLGSFGGADTGDKFASVPSYMEPQDFDSLPDAQTATGRDRRSIYGFFNRAHADHWCDPQTFGRVVGVTRGSPDPVDRLVCAYLAERLYRGVDPVYTRRTEGRRGVSPVPVCHLLGVAEAGDIDDDLPYYVHPGYLDVPGITAKRGPRVGDPDYLKTIIHWCDKIPVMDVDPEDFVGEAKEDGEVARLTIEGMHFAGNAGTIEVTLDGLGAVTGDIESWSNNEVSVTFPISSLPDPFDGEVGTIVLTRDDGVATVGERFVRFSSGGGGCSLDPNSLEPGLTANAIVMPLQGPTPTTVTVQVPVTRGTGTVSVDLNRLDGTGQPTITLGAGVTDTVSPPETVEIAFQTVFAGVGTYRLRIQAFDQGFDINRVYQTNDDGTVTTTLGVGGPDPKLEPDCAPVFFESTQ